MIQVPVPKPPSPREEEIEILARGLCELMMRGCKPVRGGGVGRCPRLRQIDSISQRQSISTLAQAETSTRAGARLENRVD